MKPAPPGTDTHDRILAEAAALFAQRGFHGTSTRDIAAAVGVRQPSLFHHFATKQAILAELLDRDLGPALDRIRRLRSAGGSAAARLHAYLAADVAALIGFPFDARGLYDEEVLGDPAFAEQRRCREAFHAEIEALVREGLAAHEFREIDPEFAQQVIHAMTVETIFQVAGHRDDDLSTRPREIADFVLLGLLRDPAALAGVRTRAEELS